MISVLLILQIAVPCLLIVCILLQQRGTALGSAFGGSGGGFYSKRRGAEKKIFIATIVLSILFIIVSILNLVNKS
ncbi:MAG: preprotein translocase subunit SecG [bacterium]